MQTIGKPYILTTVDTMVSWLAVLLTVNFIIHFARGEDDNVLISLMEQQQEQLDENEQLLRELIIEVSHSHKINFYCLYLHSVLAFPPIYGEESLLKTRVEQYYNLTLSFKITCICSMWSACQSQVKEQHGKLDRNEQLIENIKQLMTRVWIMIYYHCFPL